jgi:lysophospholipid acyltransferase (LPLAT)-like uncharacterized protein
VLRVRVSDPGGELLGRAGEPRVYVLWHNRALFVPWLVSRRRRRELAFLASRSRDGGYIAELLAALGMQAVRGSSSRGGAMALRQLQECLAQGLSVCVTPDGPRGPRYEVQEGVVWLAARTGVAVVPVAVNAFPHWELRSWDRTQLPRPLGRLELVFGPPLRVTLTPGLDERAEVARWQATIREALLAVCAGDHA